MAEPTNISEAEKEKLKEIETLNKAIDNLKELKSQGNEALVYAHSTIISFEDKQVESEFPRYLDEILIGTNDEIDNYAKIIQKDIHKDENGDVWIKNPLSTTIDVFIDGLEKQRDFKLEKINEETAYSRFDYELTSNAKYYTTLGYKFSFYNSIFVW